jgi:hypothetical protein
MSLQQNIQLYELEALLKQKRNVFDKMLNENKEFEEVKILFQEIREMERRLEQQRQSIISKSSNQTEKL